MNFGVLSVGRPEVISSVVNILGESVAQGNRVIVVVSAMSGVTDQLIGSVREAAAGNRWGYLSCSQKLRDRHHEVINLLTVPGKNRGDVLNDMEILLSQHSELGNAINISGEATP